MASVAELDAVLAQQPYHWLARYARGLNNLYWPVGFRRVDKALSDLGFALAIQQHVPDEKPGYFAFTYAAYGDALVKAGQIDAGVRVWQEGAQKYPDSALLLARVAAGREGAESLVRAERGIEDFARPRQGTTDLSLMWQ